MSSLPQPTHLSAEQGSFEERAEPYLEYGEEAPQNTDVVMRQEHLGSFWLCQKAGKCGA